VRLRPLRLEPEPRQQTEGKKLSVNGQRVSE
jgi:hypothetical protein